MNFSAAPAVDVVPVDVVPDSLIDFLPIKTFSGWEWLLIDAATQFGLDKLRFEDRLTWSLMHLTRLESMIEASPMKERPLFIKAVMAIRRAQRGEEIGHLVGLDASASGIQIMSVLTGCLAGAKATGLVDPNEPSDVYRVVTNVMNGLLDNLGCASVTVSRADAKQATMTTMYGSKQIPETLFGEQTIELSAFYSALENVAPGPWMLLQRLIGAWNPRADVHEWALPDGFEARVKVMIDKTARLEIDELGPKGSSFTYQYHAQQPLKKDVSLAANTIHSIDAYVVRSMHRRCNYDKTTIVQAQAMIRHELMQRLLGLSQDPKLTSINAWSNSMQPIDARSIRAFRGRCQLFGLVDGAILPRLDSRNVEWLGTDELQGLAVICAQMLSHPPFELVTIHDEFRCHPNHVDQVRRHYRELLALLAGSRVMETILWKLQPDAAGTSGGEPEDFTSVKASAMLPPVIRQSNYALC